MYIIREVFTAKPGHASKLAKLFKKTWTGNPKPRIMTDVVGPYKTVVMEVETKNLAEWEKILESYKKGEPDPHMDADMAEEMAKYTDMYQTGRREIYQILE